MQIFGNLPIRYKLFFTYALVSLVVFSLSFSLLFFQMRKTLEDRIGEELTKSNRMVADMVETSASVSIKNHLRAIAEKNREIVEFLYNQYKNRIITESEARERAARILLSQTVGETGYIYCLDSRGKILVHPRPGVLGENLAHRRFIRTQIKKKAGYLEYDWKNPGEEAMRPKALYMSYFQPWDWIISVSSYKSEFSKLVSIDDFRDRIIGLTFGRTGYAFIFDTEGRIVIHPEISGNFMDRTDVNGLNIGREMIKRKNGFITYDWRNPSEKKAREKYVAFNTIADFNWIIASSSYTREVFSPLYEMQKIFLAILLVSLLTIGGATLAVSSSITKPLTSFISRLERGGQEDLAFRMDDSGKDEIGKLAGSFNRFMARLEAFRGELVSEIRDRKQAQNELNSLRNYLVNIIDSMPSVLVGVDGAGLVTLWNKRAEERTGIALAQALARPLDEVFPRLAPRMQKIQKSLEKNRIEHISKLAHISENREISYEEITIYPLTAGGVQDAVIRIDDVTEKVRMEEVLIQNEKMVSVGGLAAGMAHEINNPLAGVLQNASVLENRLTDTRIPANLKAAQTAGTTMEAVREFMGLRQIPRILNSINDSGRRMASIVNNVLGFARKSNSSFTSLDPVDLMDKTLELAATDYDLKKEYDFKSILIEREYEDNLPKLFCQRSEVQQVILNILNNGAHVMFENRKAKDSPIPRFVLRLLREPDSDMLRMEIQDNGPGMDEKIAKRIFEPFFTTKSVGSGTGLGLSISYFIITENHRGTMEVVSEPGQGANFIIRLPLPPGKTG